MGTASLRAATWSWTPAVPRPAPRPFSRSPYGLAMVIGLMFWLSRNRFVGSYFSFSASNR
jgi:hypothetical protein